MASLFTKTYHKTTYPAIDPSRPELSASNKTVIITGAGSGIGSAVAHSYAVAGAQKIAVIGRRRELLEATKQSVEKSHPATSVFVATADISNAESVGKAAHLIRAEVGAWDVFVHCAGYLSDAATLTGSDFDDWWEGFKVNIQFSHHFAKHFLTKCRPNATFISVSSAVAHLPASADPLASSYAASKLAVAKLNEFLAVQHPQLRVFTVHPGVVDTPMLRKYHEQRGSEGDADDASLPGNFMVWLASPESEFLRGRFVWANWDVEEMIAMKDTIEKDPHLLRPGMGGWPFDKFTKEA